MNRYILNAGSVLHNGKAIFEIFHNGESVYRIADGLSRTYPNLASVFANYPSVLPIVAEYPALAAVLTQYPSLASYANEVLIAAGKYPDAAPYLLGLQTPDFNYPIKLKSNITTPYTNTQIKGAKVLAKPINNTTYLFTSGAWEDDMAFFMSINDGAFQVCMGYQRFPYRYTVANNIHVNKNVEFSCIGNTATLLIPNLSVSNTSTITRNNFGGRTLTVGDSNGRAEITTLQCYDANGQEIHRLLPLSESSVYDVLTQTVIQ